MEKKDQVIWLVFREVQGKVSTVEALRNAREASEALDQHKKISPEVRFWLDPVVLSGSEL